MSCTVAAAAAGDGDLGGNTSAGRVSAGVVPLGGYSSRLRLQGSSDVEPLITLQTMLCVSRFVHRITDDALSFFSVLFLSRGVRQVIADHVWRL